ncbi:Uncharacterised protein [Klebsiella pneumoniae]|nr:Uncharacterised protein [Klebsiella pneumoniae]
MQRMVEVVAAHHHRDTALAKSRNEVIECRLLSDIQSCQRLIEQQQLAFRLTELQQYGGQPHALPLSAGELMQRALKFIGQLELLCQRQ